MARRTVTITIEDAEDPENRDIGKTFVITEMPALVGERWAAQLLTLLAKSAVDVPDLPPPESGMSGLAALSKAKIAAPLISALQDPSLDAWLGCVQFQPKKAGLPLQKIAEGERCQIEEISTVSRLRFEVLDLHTGFFSKEKASTSATPSPKPTGSSPTRISRPASAQ